MDGIERGGVGPLRHDDPNDRPAAIFSGKVKRHAAAESASLLLPVIPRK